jgi:hypothetical protein
LSGRLFSLFRAKAKGDGVSKYERKYTRYGLHKLEYNKKLPVSVTEFRIPVLKYFKEH